jgi:magnesium-transporting ATPase (P-type)
VGRRDTLEAAAKMGVEVKMITGDHVTIAVETARVLGLGTRIQGPQGLPTLQEGGAVPDRCAPAVLERFAPVLSLSLSFSLSLWFFLSRPG